MSVPREAIRILSCPSFRVQQPYTAGEAAGLGRKYSPHYAAPSSIDHQTVTNGHVESLHRSIFLARH